MSLWYALWDLLPFEMLHWDFMKNALLALFFMAPLFGLLSTMGLLGRTSKLCIYGPENLRPVLEFFKSTFGEGLLYEIDFMPLSMKSPEVIYQNRTTELLAFPLSHRVDTFGFMVREKMPQHNVRKDAIAR